eukprot:s774_g14.t1
MKRVHSPTGAALDAASRRQRAESPRLPEGPSAAEELYLWPKRILDQAAKMHGREVLIQNMAAKKGLVMTTTFSGVGSAELAAELLLDALREDGLVQPGFDFHVHSACDKDAMCREVLMHHDPGFAPDHVFAQVDDCLPDHIRARLESLLFAAQSEVVDKTFPTARDRSQAIEVRGQKLIKDCLDILANTNVLSQGACHACKKMCSRFPDAAKRMVYLWLEVAGSPCIPFIKGGAYGTGLAWLHETTISFLSWGRAMRAKKPDMILHECVPGFTPETLQKVLNQHEDLYDITSLVLSPDDMGYAVRRERRYSLCVLKKSCEKTEGLFDENLAQMLFAAPWIR